MEQCFMIENSGIVDPQPFLGPAAFPYNSQYIVDFNLSILYISRNQKIFHLIALLAHPIESSI